ncbi:MAG: FkbM family methyltransferase [Opitutales bacterium]|jgi:FkbM family methyltransferase
MSSEELEQQEKEAILDFFGRRAEGYFVEIGANDPRQLSQTWLLEQRGWTGLLVEPQQGCFDKLVAARPRSRVVRAACAGPESRGTGSLHVAQSSVHSSLAQHVDDQGVNYVGLETVPIVTVDELLEQMPPKRVDFVSIDVEGTELDVLRGFDLARWKPELLLIEDKVNNLQKHRYILQRGYRLLRRTGVNGWYVPREHPARPATGAALKLWRKYYLGTPLRRMKRAWQARKLKIKD